MPLDTNGAAVRHGRDKKYSLLGGNDHYSCRYIGKAGYKVIAVIFHVFKAWALLADSEKEDPGFQDQVQEEISPHLLSGAQGQRLGAKQDQLPCGATGTSSSNCQETETRMVRACHAPRQPLQYHHSKHLRGWATPRSAKEMLDEQERTSLPKPELLTMASRTSSSKPTRKILA